MAPLPTALSRRSLTRAARQYVPGLALIGACAGGFFVLRHGTLEPGVGAVGYAESIHHAVAPLAPGRIAELRVHVGQALKAGDVVAILDGRALVATREGAAAELERLRAELAATAQDEDTKVTRSELWVLRARASEHGERASLAEVSGRMARLEGLLEKQMVGASEAELTRERVRSLSARVQTYDQAAAVGQAGHEKGGREKGLVRDDHERIVNTRIEPARIAVRVQEIALKKLDLALEELVLKAPVDGVVTTISHRPGEVVDAATEIVSIVSARPGVVLAIIPERAASKIGSAARVHRASAFAANLEGDVIEVAPEVEEVPVRARTVATVPTWGRRVTIRLRGDVPVLPGEAFRVTLR